MSPNKFDLASFHSSSGVWPFAALSESINLVLQSVPLMSLSIGAGEPNVCPVYFALYDDASLCFISNISSRHAKLLDKTEAASVAIYDSSQPWTNPKVGIQMIGICKQASIMEAIKARSRYAERFPDCSEDITTSEMVSLALDGFRFFLFAPTRIKIFDEPRFGEETYIELVGDS